MTEKNAMISVLERLLATEQYEEVVRICSAAQLGEELPKKFWYCKARALERLGRFREAIECYRAEIASLERVPWPILGNIGGLLMDSGQYDEARMCLQRFCEVKQTVEGLVLLASALWHLGKDVEARQTIQAALEIDPSWDEAWHNLGAYLLDESSTDAEAAFRRAIEIDPCRADSYGGIGKACLRQGRFEEAIEVAEKGLQIDAACGLCHFVMGQGLEALGQADRAKDAFLKAYHCDAYDKVEALLSLARLSESTGQLDSAGLWLERATRGWPDDSRIAKELAAFAERRDAAATPAENPIEETRDSK